MFPGFGSYDKKMRMKSIGELINKADYDIYLLQDRYPAFSLAPKVRPFRTRKIAGLSTLRATITDNSRTFQCMKIS